ncbi:MAG: hypothetical protein KC419_02800 [Anaerolineales bacterium]|nr:hypothetical protein [Anaerolineales bacterium]
MDYNGKNETLISFFFRVFRVFRAQLMKKLQLSPIQKLLAGFVLLALLGAGLLALPIANAQGEWQPFIDALFMSTSAVTTTGLGVVSTGNYYNLFGQIIILALFQVGGLGYMTLLVFIIELFGQSLSLEGGNLMEESLALPSRGEMRSFVKRVVIFTLLFEGMGALALLIYWLPEYSFGRALYFSVFHSVSAFCTAGFALFESGFVPHQNSWAFNIIINVISIAGAIGFFVLSEAYTVLHKLWQKQPIRHFSMHSKLAILVTSALIFAGTTIYWMAEFDTATTWSHQLLAASFQIISAASTTGFNTVDLSSLQPVSQFVIAVLMFIGSPAGGTGGGIKSTTFGVLILLLWSILRSHRDVTAFNRRLTNSTILRSVSIALTAVLWLVFSLIVLSVTETPALSTAEVSVPFLTIVFEASSALGTVGLSTGLTPELSTIGRLIITLSMMIGRVGPLAFAVSLFGKENRAILYRHPREEVFVG